MKLAWDSSYFLCIYWQEKQKVVEKSMTSKFQNCTTIKITSRHNDFSSIVKYFNITESKNYQLLMQIKSLCAIRILIVVQFWNLEKYYHKQKTVVTMVCSMKYHVFGSNNFRLQVLLFPNGVMDLSCLHLSPSLIVVSSTCRCL